MQLSHRKTQASLLGLQPLDAWLVILGFVSITAGLLIARQGRLVNFEFPGGALLVGLYLYRKYPILYFGFTLWVWFLCSFVRRAADLSGGWTNPSPVLLAPGLVSFITFIGFYRILPRIVSEGGLPFLLCGGSIFYSFLIGLASQSISTTIVSFLGWFPPISLGLHLFIHWRNYPAFKSNIHKTFLWGTLVVGVYGLYQYFTAPAWDAFWMENTYRELGLNSIGKPEPLEIRVFSTLNAPQALGAMLMPGLILLFTNKHPVQAPATITGFLSFLLSSARSAWMSWGIALLAYGSFLTTKMQFRLILTFLIAILALTPLITIEPFSSAITPRLESMTNVKADGSVQGRAETFNRLVNEAMVSYIGRGVGQDGGAGMDQGILVLMFSLGWLGVIPYVLGLALAFMVMVQNPCLRVDPFANSALAIALGGVSQFLSNVPTTGVLGAMLWIFLGIGMAATKYYKARQGTSLRRSQP